MEFKQDLDYSNALIVDGLNIAFRWKHQKSLVFAKEYISTIKSLARSYNCGTIIVAADKGSSSYRKAIHPEYKANRKKLYENQTKEEEEFIKAFFKEYENTLELIAEEGIQVFRYDGVEADDIAAFIVSHRKWYLFNEVWLISSDRDWDLMVTEGVSRFSTVTRKEQTTLTWDNPVDIDDYISFKVLTGDSGDNIIGVEGIGPKRAADLIAQYGSAYDIACSLPLPGKAKYIQNLNASGELIMLNYKLMDLMSTYEDALGKDVMQDIHKRLVNDN